MSIVLEVVSRSSAGRSHPFEDRTLVDETRGLFAVADGVTRSSQGSGAEAAEMAVKLLNEIFTGDLQKAVTAVHEIAYRRKKQEWSVGETTLTALQVSERNAVVCNVGDSSAFLFQGANITQLYNADRNIDGSLTQVIGWPENISIHTTRFELRPGEVVILGTDGVEDALRPPEIYHSLMKVNAKEIADAIINSANRRKTAYDDDKTVIVIRALKA